MRLFNRQHSGLRTVMTENVFGRMKKKFPVLRHMRTNLKNSKKGVDAIVVLHNLSILWNDELLDDEEPAPEGGEEEDDDDDEGILIQDVLLPMVRIRTSAEL